MKLRLPLALLLVSALSACEPPAEPRRTDAPPVERARPPALLHGVAAGDPELDRVNLWTRTTRPEGRVLVLVERGSERHLYSARPDPHRDNAVHVRVTGLAPAAKYRYRIWTTLASREVPSPPAEVLEGSFSTLPEADAAAPLRLAWGGDLAGQNVCRHATEGFPLLAELARLDLDFFVGLGDMIYADNACKAVGAYGQPQIPGPGPAQTRDDYWAHWRYAREDPGLRALLARTSYVGIWDDHETINDCGPQRDGSPAGQGHLLPVARAAMSDYLPLPELPPAPPSVRAPARPSPPLYRSFRWGKHVEVVVLDTRSYRDANSAPDTATAPKTMLGATQREWLTQRLLGSSATWKLVVSSVPLSIPTGQADARDGWASLDTDRGFERELTAILGAAARGGVRNLVFLTTDAHLAAAFKYVPFAEHPDFVVHELVTGPLNAGLFSAPRYDATLNPERLFYFAADESSPVTTFAAAKRWFNFGTLEVAGDGQLCARVHALGGRVVHELRLVPR